MLCLDDERHKFQRRLADAADAMRTAVLTEEGVAGLCRAVGAVVPIDALAGQDVVGLGLAVMGVVVEDRARRDGDMGEQAHLSVHLLLVQQPVDLDALFAHCDRLLSKYDCRIR